MVNDWSKSYDPDSLKGDQGEEKEESRRDEGEEKVIDVGEEVRDSRKNGSEADPSDINNHNPLHPSINRKISQMKMKTGRK